MGWRLYNASHDRRFIQLKMGQTLYPIGSYKIRAN